LAVQHDAREAQDLRPSPGVQPEQYSFRTAALVRMVKDGAAPG
jgi:hypothetical protein